MSAGVLVAGAGEAGVRLAAALRENGYAESILLVGEEMHPPYQRPPLSKAFLSGTAGDDALALRSPEFYQEQDISVRTGVRVEDAVLDADGRGTASLSDGTTVAFDRLALATGARARTLPFSGGNVHVLRSRDDAVRLRLSLEHAKRVVLIGAGFIGLEIAAVARKRGIEVVVLEQQPRLLSRVAAEPLSEFLLAAHRGWGAEFVLGSGVAAVEPDGVRLADGEFVAADTIVAGVGAVPEIGLAQRLGLACDRGVLVDAFCRTSNPAVVAIGDCAAQPHPHRPGASLGLESVQNAGDQARAAAATLTGRPAPPRAVPWFWSDQGDLKIQIAGVSDGHDRYVVRGGDGGLTVLYYRAGSLIAADAVNRPGDFMAVKRALAAGKTIAPENAADPARPLKTLVTEA
ncbi:NAD(P)/FAD-dependent oxidoreductase [Amycolatopsis sp. VC5-11]|uniref:NAD(P)/FAD-dependent oxidoreductase n=1 Tax=Amycolatopsis sp. VC5-11 TaxID=3120156 RepID=UPI00300B9274